MIYERRLKKQMVSIVGKNLYGTLKGVTQIKLFEGSLKYIYILKNILSKAQVLKFLASFEPQMSKMGRNHFLYAEFNKYYMGCLSLVFRRLNVGKYCPPREKKSSAAAGRKWIASYQVCLTEIGVLKFFYGRAKTTQFGPWVL